MSSGSERLIESLAAAADPVRLWPRLRLAFASVLAIWAGLLLLMWLGQGRQLAAASAMQHWLYLVSGLGLAAASLGTTVSALAAATPGREAAERGGLAVAVVGLIGAAAVCGLALVEASAPVAPTHSDVGCLSQAALWSILPIGILVSFLVRGWTTRPLRASLLALLCAGALGGLFVHLSCGLVSPRHVLMGHLSAPLVLALLGVYPLAALLRLWHR